MIFKEKSKIANIISKEKGKISKTTEKNIFKENIKTAKKDSELSLTIKVLYGSLPW